MINRIHLITWAVCLLILSATTAYGQGYGGATLDPATFPTLKPQRKSPAPPALILETVLELPIPGPLAGGNMEVQGESVKVPVVGGFVLVELGSGDEPAVTRFEADPIEEPDDGGWILTGKKKRFRFRTEPAGRVAAQKRSSSRSSVWKRRWQLNTPGGTPSPPLLLGKLILFGCSDNRVYALKARNGHRLWYQDLGHRILFPLVHWRGPLGPLDHDLVVVVPHPGRSIRILDPFDGKTLASFSLGQGNGQAEDEFASHPAVLADGRIVLPVQKYASGEASLVVLRPVAEQPRSDGKREMPYNGGDSETAESRERSTKTR